LLSLQALCNVVERSRMVFPANMMCLGNVAMRVLNLRSLCCAVVVVLVIVVVAAVDFYLF
jgi:hypothetical protein